MIYRERRHLQWRRGRSHRAPWSLLIAPAIGLTLGLQATAAAQDGREGIAGNEGGQLNIPVEEIVVTARKREERLRDVPVAVSAFSPAQLESSNIQSAGDLFGHVPNLYFTDTGRSTETRFTMRGVGARSPLETSVAVFVDGVYVPTVGWDMDFLEVGRLEILRGPQGALFGRNTQAGAINIVTRQPQREFGGRLRAEFDEFDTMRGDIYLTGALTDNLLVSAAALAERTDGYLTNVVLGEDAMDREEYGSRITLLYEPSDGVDASFSVDGIFQEGGFYGFGEPREGQTNVAGNHKLVGDQRNFEDVDNYGGSLSVNMQNAFGTLSSITGVRRVNSITIADRDLIDTPDRDGLPPKDIPEEVVNGADLPPHSGNYFVIGREQSIVSQEFRFASDAHGRVKWLLGAYGFVEENKASRWLGMEDSFLFTNPTNFLRDRSDQERDGYAIFGQASYSVTDRLELTVGARQTSEQVEQDLEIEYMVGGGAIQNAFSDNPEKEFSDFTPSGSIAYRWSDALMTYFSIAEGFKGGGFNLTAPQGIEGNLPFDSEQSVVYEVGAKSSLFDRRFTFDAALFWIETTDMQVTTTVIIDENIVTQATTNAAKARSKGVELELAAVPLSGLRLSGAVGYLEAEYRQYVVNPTVDLSGRRIEEIPDWTGNLSVDYTVPVSPDVDLTLGVLYRYVGDVLYGRGLPEQPHILVDSYDNTDVRVTLRADQWDVALYAQNVFDDYNIFSEAINVDFVRTPGFYGSQRAEPPRRVGLSATYRF